jgi:hypothetical protein
MRESPQTLAKLQGLIDHSVATAGRAIRQNFASADWRMSAIEFVDFWGEARMASISTASRKGLVHAVPLDIHLVDGTFYIPTFPDSRRLQDHRENARCVITSWEDPFRAAIVIGLARETSFDPTGRTDATAAEQGYGDNSMVTIEVEPTRIYAIRPPLEHHASSSKGAT